MKFTKSSKYSFIIAPFMFISILLISSCSQTQQNVTALSKSVSPNSCRIVGTIQSIENIKDSSGPCAEQPCVANVKIENILERGMSFNNSLSRNDIIQLKFAFTLEPTTAEAFPKLKKHFPGLKPGDKFKGDVETITSIQIAGTETPDKYYISNYDVIK